MRRRPRHTPNPGPNPNPALTLTCPLPLPLPLTYTRWICDATDKMHTLVPAAIKEEAEAAGKAFREAMDDD